MQNTKQIIDYIKTISASLIVIFSAFLYLHFPYVIGQSGILLYSVLIFIPFFISLSTGISVASILKTDKSENFSKTINQQFGYPLKGVFSIILIIGFVLILCLISLGFSENISNFLGFENSKILNKIVAVSFLIFCVILYYLTDSLNKKINAVILILSLISVITIILGFYSHEFSPEKIHFLPTKDSNFLNLLSYIFPIFLGFSVLFFEKLIKNETLEKIWAKINFIIGLGFLFLISIGFFLVLTVDYLALINNVNIVYSITVLPIILILTAILVLIFSAYKILNIVINILLTSSKEQVTPFFLSKNHGTKNKPTYAILTILLSSVLIILFFSVENISKFLTFFSLTSFVVFNIFVFVKSLKNKNSNFQTFIIKGVSIFGAIFSIVLMLFLNIYIFVILIKVFILLYIYFKRKESSIDGLNYKSKLLKLNIKELAEKDKKNNWLPNILLFNDLTEISGEFIKFPEKIFGNIGFITNVNLEITNSEVDSVKQIKNLEKSKNYFDKKFIAGNYYTAIESISEIYGFSGVEPNTVLLNFNSIVKETQKAQNLLKNLHQIKFNSLILKNNNSHNNIEISNIDFWIYEEQNNFSFVVKLLKIISANKDNNNLKIRILIISNNTESQLKQKYICKQYIDNESLIAEIEIFDNAEKKQNIYELIKIESQNSDLIILGISEKSIEELQNFTENISKNFENKQLLLINSSTEFTDIQLNIFKNKSETIENISDIIFFEPNSIENDLLQEKYIEIHTKTIQFYSIFYSESIKEIEKLQKEQLNEVFIIIETYIILFNSLEKTDNKTKEYYELYDKFLNNVILFIENYNTDCFIKTCNIFEEKFYLSQKYLIEYFENIPEILNIKIDSIQKQVQFKQLISFYLTSKIQSKLSNFVDTYFNLVNKNNNEIIKFFDSLNKKFKENSYLDDIMLISLKQNILNEIELQNSTFTKEIILNELIAEITNLMLESSIIIKNGNSYNNLIKNKILDLIESQGVIESIKNQNKKLRYSNNSKLADFYLIKTKSKLLDTTENFHNEINLIFETKFNSDDNIILNNSFLNEKNIEITLENVNFINIYEKQFSEFKKEVEKLPLELELSNSTKILIRKIISIKYNTEIELVISSLLLELENKFSKTVNSINDVKRLNKFNLENNEIEPIDIKTKLNQIQKEAEKEQYNLENFHIELIEKVFETLQSHTLLHEFNTNAFLALQMSNSKLKHQLNIKYKNLVLKISKIIKLIISGKSQGILLAKKISSNEIEYNFVEQIFETVEKTKISKQVLDKLPKIYISLFNSEIIVNKDFIIKNKNLISKAKKAVERFKSGTFGGILITGDFQSGKTTLAFDLADEFAENFTIKRFVPENHGNFELNDFEQCVRKTLNKLGNIDQIIENLQVKHILIFDDIELWWTRSENGMFVIDKIFSLMEKFGNKHLFIVLCNIHSFKFFNNYKKYNQYFNCILETNACDSDTLKEIIMLRHQTGGLKYIFKNQNEDELSEIKKSVLFDSIFNLSMGNLGAALTTWKRSIKTYDENKLKIEIPNITKTQILNLLDENQKIILVQIVIHKQLNINKIEKIYKKDTTKILTELQILIRCGLVTLNNDVYKLNPNFAIFIIKFLKNSELL